MTFDHFMELHCNEVYTKIRENYCTEDGHHSVIMFRECRRMYNEMECGYVKKHMVYTLELGHICALAKEVMYKCRCSLNYCIDDGKHFEDSPCVAGMIPQIIIAKYPNMSRKQCDLVFDETLKMCKDMYNETRMDKMNRDIRILKNEKHFKKVEPVEDSPLIDACVWLCVVAGIGSVGVVVGVGLYTVSNFVIGLVA